MTSLPSKQRVALVHDFLLDLRGAERVFLELCHLWPQADIFTAVYDPEGTEGRFEHRTVHTSFLQRLRPTARTFRGLLPLYPAAVEHLDLAGYDLVVSSSSAWAHAVRPAPGAVHVSYCHNPFRYAWNEREETIERRNPLLRPALRSLFDRWRRWDWNAAQRTDRYVANAHITQRRISTYFGRRAEIVYPPVRTERFAPGPVGDHYAFVSELVSHKQIDVAIGAFNRLGRPLVIVGDGPDYRRLRRLAGPTIRFAGRLPDESVAEVLASARALIVTSVEEFGISAVESQAAGRPVLARGEGGALETVIDGVTGCHWSGGPDELAAAVTGFDEEAVDPAACVRSAERFDVVQFGRGLREQVALALEQAGDVERVREPAEARRLRLLAPELAHRAAGR
jgi:glycosyltransferase involved in cell wall biosynthesis